MSLFDLKPLTDVAIAELALDANELWNLKIGDQQFGPFETLSLRHYALENKSDFDGAFATRLHEDNWKYFQNIAEFHDIFVVPEIPEEEKGEWYWVLELGKLSQALSFEDMEKKIELGLLSLTDAVSTDEGKTWNKIFHMDVFAHKLHTSKELPQCPLDSQFQLAKIKVLEKIEERARAQASNQENMSGLAFLGQKSTQIVVLKIDEIKLEALQETEISSSMKWAIPSIAMGMIALVMSGYFFFGGPTDEALLITENDFQLKRSISGTAANYDDGKRKNSNRRPSSVKPFRSQRSDLTRNSFQETSYPTHIETHQEVDERDPQHEPAFDEQPAAPQTEESLVQNTQPQNPDQSLDAAMNEVAQPEQQPLEQPQVEEVSDF
jgi:hypothetical protein